MKISKKEVKTIYDIEITWDEIKNVFTEYTNSDALQIVFPKAFDGLKFIDRSNFDLIGHTHGDTYSVIAKNLGFDGWKNAGYADKTRGTYRMTVYHDGDRVNE